MSRGPGSFQRKLLAELRAAHGLLPRAELCKKFPLQAEDHSLHRALRSLERMKYIEDLELDGQRCIALRGPGLWSEAAREQFRLATTQLRLLRNLAAARGVHPSGLDDLAAKLDAYQRAAE